MALTIFVICNQVICVFLNNSNMLVKKFVNIFLVIGISVLSVFALAFLIWDIVIGFNFGTKPVNVKNLELKWSVQEFKNHQSGQFFHGKLVFFVDNQNNILALDRETGKELLKRDLKQLSGGEIFGKPVFFANKIYVATLDSKSEKVGMILNCLSIDDLSIKWQKPFGGTFKEFLVNDKYLIAKTDEYVIPTGCEVCDEETLKKFDEKVDKTRYGEYAFFVLNTDTGDVLKKIEDNGGEDFGLESDFLYYRKGSFYSFSSSSIGVIDLSNSQDVWSNSYDSVFEYSKIDNLIVGLVSRGNALFFVALDKKNGQEKWQFLLEKDFDKKEIISLVEYRTAIENHNGWIRWKNKIIDLINGKLVAEVAEFDSIINNFDYIIFGYNRPFVYYVYRPSGMGGSTRFKLDLEHRCGLDANMSLKDVKLDCPDKDQLYGWSNKDWAGFVVVDNMAYSLCHGSDSDRSKVCVFDLSNDKKVVQSNFEMFDWGLRIAEADGGLLIKDLSDRNFYYFELAK